MIKPTANIKGIDGNVFSLLRVARAALKQAGLRSQAEEVKKRIVMDNEAKDYDHAIRIMMEYVDFCGF